MTQEQQPVEYALAWFEDEPTAIESFKHDTKHGRILAAEVRRLREENAKLRKQAYEIERLHAMRAKGVLSP